MTDKTIVALYDRFEDARSAVKALESGGLQGSDISLVSADPQAASGSISGGTPSAQHITLPGIGPAAAMGQMAEMLGAAGDRGGLVTALSSAGVPDGDANIYAEGVRRGGTLIAIIVDDDRVEKVVDILTRSNPVDVERRREALRKEGWSGFESGGGGGMSGAAAGLRETDRSAGGTQEQRIPIASEEVSVGKRQMERGGVRVHSRVVERPVEEQVTLREETVGVERRPASGDVPADAFQEKTVEMRETEEVPVVRKQTQAQEEVVIRKEAEEHTETVRDTARETQVEVERPGEKKTQR